jgi:hypothetical protein
MQLGEMGVIFVLHEGMHAWVNITAFFGGLPLIEVFINMEEAVIRRGGGNIGEEFQKNASNEYCVGFKAQSKISGSFSTAVIAWASFHAVRLPPIPANKFKMRISTQKRENTKRLLLSAILYASGQINCTR